MSWFLGWLCVYVLCTYDVLYEPSDIIDTQVVFKGYRITIFKPLMNRLKSLAG